MGIIVQLKSFVTQSKRVWLILKRPSSLEFKTISKVSAIGIAIMGAVGFVIADTIRIITNLLT
ncbi:protein translocase SEC61 complex subunit gamma [Candidatus Pacearchaeota archaeon]|nr:protein translocase SEC61 complex subunit gamma [Candidatus Pacearchaeota archaeon]